MVVDSFGRTTEMWGAHRDPNVPMEDESDLYKLRAIAYKKPLNKKDGVLLVKNWIRSSWDTPKNSAVRKEKVQTSLNLSTLTLSETKLKPKKVDGKLEKQKRGP